MRARVTGARSVRRQLAQDLPESVAAAAMEFLTGPLLDNPRRVGKALRPPLEDRLTARRGTYRVAYRIDDRTREVIVVLVVHRRDAD